MKRILQDPFLVILGLLLPGAFLYTVHATPALIRICMPPLLLAGSFYWVRRRWNRVSGCWRAMAAAEGCAVSCLQMALLHDVQTTGLARIDGWPYVIISFLGAYLYLTYSERTSRNTPFRLGRALVMTGLALPAVQVFVALGNRGADTIIWRVQIGHSAFWWLASIVLLVISWRRCETAPAPSTPTTTGGE